MTTEQFLNAFGSEYRILTGTPMWSALLQTIDDASPLRQSPNEPFQNAAVAGQTLYNQCQGWEMLRRFLTSTLLPMPSSGYREPDYSEPPIQSIEVPSP